ncbi:MAG: monomethylamine:corrinoid methyltransferase [Anaerolineales bacterium]|nr:monomethylamine:corrinoid methyltransferase [Anaerolineales bacterium]
MKHTTRLMDIIQRSLTGPLMDEEDFNDKHVTQGLARVIKAYDIHINQDQIINQDDALADRVWEAAVDFLASCGVYCQTTNRLILFSKTEILDILKYAPANAWIGEGTDAVQEVARKIEDPRRPLLMGSSIGTPIEDEYFVPSMISYIQEPEVDVTMAPTLTNIYGYDIRTRSPLEILSSWREVELTLEAMRRAGRPGMGFTGVGSSISDVGQLSSDGPGGLRQTDLHTFGIISELKTNFEILNKLTHIIMRDGIVDPYANPIYGGLGGGMDGQAILITAAMIALNVFFMATCVGTSPTHPFNFNDTGKELLLSSGLSFQALARNSKLMTNLTNTPVGGPGTKTLLYECIALTVMMTVSGGSRILGPRSATGSITGHFSGLEARFTGELLTAASKLSRDKAEEIVQKAYSKYEQDLAQKPYGKHFKDVYDLKTIQPTAEWCQLYDEVKNEAAGWGLSFD